MKIVATCPNWMTARRTLGAVKSFKSFYPDIEMIIVDDHSDPKDKHVFDDIYKKEEYRPDIIYDPDTSVLKDIHGTKFVRVRAHNFVGKGHGNAIDTAMKNTNADWLFHMDSDIRIIKPGIIEEMVEHINDKVAAIGEFKIVNPEMPNLHNTFALYNITLAKQLRLSFKPIIYGDGIVKGYFPLTQETGQALEAGTEFCGIAHRFGYDLVNIPGLISNYGHHLRYVGENKDEVWEKYY